MSTDVRRRVETDVVEDENKEGEQRIQGAKVEREIEVEEEEVRS